MWRVGYGAARPGMEMQGARLHWELKHWKYPIAKEGTAQAQDPDDNTADGADLIAADRYAIMSWWKPAIASGGSVGSRPIQPLETTEHEAPVRKEFEHRFDRV
jgi:hypothetical protein